MDPRDIIIRPILTEKTTLMSETGKYAFRVHDGANKLDIGRAVEELFRVDVVAVNVSRVRGKWRRYGRSRGRRSDWKKAVVTLQAGQSIELFPGT
jgi:large subunit ribosomal protein L23